MSPKIILLHQTVKQQLELCWPCIGVVYKSGHATDLWPCQLQVLSLWLEMRDETLQVWNHSYFRVHGNSHKSTHCSCALIENTKNTSGVLSFTWQNKKIHYIRYTPDMEATSNYKGQTQLTPSQAKMHGLICGPSIHYSPISSLPFVFWVAHHACFILNVYSQIQGFYVFHGRQLKWCKVVLLYPTYFFGFNPILDTNFGFKRVKSGSKNGSNWDALT